ncbi:MAG TPA: hypothetical protein VHE12_04190 [bacterium]|nr:hypothetical protein [bacterium]
MKKALLSILLVLVVAPLWAGPPMKVVYSTSRTAKFDWKWPYHPIERFSAVQTKPYHYASRVASMNLENVAKYRFYFPEKTCHREWGYFFTPGTKLCPKHPVIIFGAPKNYDETIYLQK